MCEEPLPGPGHAEPPPGSGCSPTSAPCCLQCAAAYGKELGTESPGDRAGGSGQAPSPARTAGKITGTCSGVMGQETQRYGEGPPDNFIPSFIVALHFLLARDSLCSYSTCPSCFCPWRGEGDLCTDIKGQRTVCAVGWAQMGRAGAPHTALVCTAHPEA